MAGTLEEFLVLYPDGSSSTGYLGQTGGLLVDLDQLKLAARSTLDCEHLEFVEFTMPKGAHAVVIADAQAAEKMLPLSHEVTKFIRKFHDPQRTIQGAVLLFRNKCWKDDAEAPQEVKP